MNLAVKLMAGAMLVLAVGVPVLDTWKALLVAAGLLAVAFGTTTTRWRRVAAAAVVVVAVIAVKAQLPRADIAEGHNVFLVAGDGEPLQQALPAPIFAAWRAQFEALYPANPQSLTDRSHWRANRFIPKTLFTESSDAIWRTAKYTRQVDAIDFRTLGEFRGGFANEIYYNFWSGPLRRESMPFFVMYQLTGASVGSRLAWKGQVFWERSDGGFDEIVHTEVASREIVADDAGRRVYAAFFSTPGSILSHERDHYFQLQPSLMLRLGGSVDALLTAAAATAVLMLTVTPRWPEFLRALMLFGAGYALVAAYIWVSLGKYLGRWYPPHGGGDDGLVHDGYGRVMAMMAGRGDIVAALQGIEPVYWFTPGTRYVRMLEKLVFGDTNHLFALLVACVPVVVFYVLRRFVADSIAAVVTAAFIVLPVGSLAFLPYVANAKLGYGDALGCGLFLLGLAIVLGAQPRWGGTSRNLPLLTVAGGAMAASMFVRPNVAFAVVWMAAAFSWLSLKDRDFRAVAALGIGLSLALWMPFHNWYYGDAFYLISESGASVSVPLGPRDYVTAAEDLLRGDARTEAVAATAKQLTGWLWNPGLVVTERVIPLAWASHLVKLLALIVTAVVGLRWAFGRLPGRDAVGVVAVAALCAHVPMLFIFSTHYRYAMLGWDLSLVVLIATLAPEIRPFFSARVAPAPSVS